MDSIDILAINIFLTANYMLVAYFICSIQVMLVGADRRQLIILFTCSSSITAAVSCIIGLQYGHILAHLEVRYVSSLLNLSDLENFSIFSDMSSLKSYSG